MLKKLLFLLAIVLPTHAFSTNKTAMEICDNRDGSFCWNIGMNFLTGNLGFRVEPYTAAELFKRSCDKGDSRGCNSLGALYMTGEGIEKNEKKGAEFFYRSCSIEKVSGVGCFNLGKVFFNGTGFSIDYSKAAVAFSKSCRSNYAESCFYLGEINAKGHGVSADTKKALDFYKKSCDLKFEAGCKSYISLKKKTTLKKEAS